MKVGFIGLGRMGQAMAGRLLDGGHDIGLYNRTPEKIKALTDRGAKPLISIGAFLTSSGSRVVPMFGEVVFKVMSASFTSTVSVVAPGDIGTLMFAILATSTVISVLTVLNAGASTVTE